MKPRLILPIYGGPHDGASLSIGARQAIPGNEIAFGKSVYIVRGADSAPGHGPHLIYKENQ